MLLTGRIGLIGTRLINRESTSLLRFNRLLYSLAHVSNYSTGKTASHDNGKRSIKISTGAFVIPKSVKDPKRGLTCTPLECGEDSYCIAENEKEVVLGVADGVGSWSERGIDPSVFSQTLMHNASEIAKLPSEKYLAETDRPKALIHDAFKKLIEDYKGGKNKALGSSTACVVMIDKEGGHVKFGNLGDSGFMILSCQETKVNGFPQYRIKYQSNPRQHGFNYPYQLGLISENGKARDESNLTDTDTTLIVNLSLNPNDIVLVVTDGVSDNLAPTAIEGIVSNSFNVHSKANPVSDIPRLIAEDVAFVAHKCSYDRKHQSPFSVEARKNGYNFNGGKVDDITVVAAVVSEK